MTKANYVPEDPPNPDELHDEHAQANDAWMKQRRELKSAQALAHEKLEQALPGGIAKSAEQILRDAALSGKRASSDWALDAIARIFEELRGSDADLTRTFRALDAIAHIVKKTGRKA